MDKFNNHVTLFPGECNRVCKPHTCFSFLKNRTRYLCSGKINRRLVCIFYSEAGHFASDEGGRVHF